ncbi:MAG: single-stranded DNA-binding protein [Deferribacteraceae bacterium]|jgi:single-strand DNA-binding protein|nr:single-stranded DNA-binding protein [Deferribacteraceae bacterium]
MNNINFVGRFVKDPAKFNNGNGIKFTLAQNNRYKKKDGETAEDTCFIDVTSFLATEAIAKHKKGYLIGVTGRLKQELWEKDGQKYSKHIIMVKEVTFFPNEKKDNDSEQDGEYTSSWDENEHWNP